MGRIQVKIIFSQGRSNRLKFATFGDVSEVLSSSLLASPRCVFDSLKKNFGFILFRICMFKSYYVGWLDTFMILWFQIFVVCI